MKKNAGDVIPLLVGWLSTGCPVLDKALHGGLLVPGITEIAGTSAAGKTQLCLQLCLTVQLPREKGGLEGGRHRHITLQSVYTCSADPIIVTC